MRHISAALLFFFASYPSHALDKVTFGSNWVAQAEHGGFYQAIADGTYEKYGLDVTIKPGGPQINNRLLMTSGKIEFFMGGNLVEGFNLVQTTSQQSSWRRCFRKTPKF